MVTQGCRVPNFWISPFCASWSHLVPSDSYWMSAVRKACGASHHYQIEFGRNPTTLSNSKCTLGRRLSRNVIPLPCSETVQASIWNETLHIKPSPDAPGRPTSARSVGWIQDTGMNIITCPTDYTARESSRKARLRVRAVLFTDRPKPICLLTVQLGRLLTLDWGPWPSNSWKRLGWHLANNNLAFRDTHQAYQLSEIPARSSHPARVLSDTKI